MALPVLPEPERDRLVQGLLLEPAHRLEVGLVAGGVVRQGTDRRGAALRVAAPPDVYRDGGRAVLGAPRDDRQDELVGRRRLDLERPKDRVTEGVATEPEASAEHRWDRRQRIPQVRDDAEVAAATAKAPKQLGLALLVDLEHVAVRRHELGADQRVARKPLRRQKPADPAGQGQATDPGVDEGPGRRSQAVGEGCRVEVHQPGPGERVRGFRSRVDRRSAPPRQVDQERSVRRGVAGDAVAAAPNAYLETGLRCPTDRSY